MLSDIGCERAVLSGICQFGKNGLLEVDDIVSEEAFTESSNRVLFEVLKKSLSVYETVDITSIVSTAKDLGMGDIIAKSKTDIEYIKSLFLFPIEINNLRNFAKKIAKLSVARKAQEKHKDAYDDLSKVNGTESIDEIISISEKPIFDLLLEVNRGKNNGPELISEDIDDLLDSVINNQCDNVGVPTPWKVYNAIIGGGFRRGGVNLIGARPGRGKSTLAKTVAEFLTKDLGIKVLLLDTEMAKYDHQFRLLSSMTKIPINEIEKGVFAKSDYSLSQVRNASEKIKNNKNFFFESIAGMKFDEILSIIRRWILKEVGFNADGKTNNCLIIYDYFKLMSKSDLGSLKEYEAMGYQISKFTDFSKEYDFPVLAFVQLNREEDISQSDRLLWLCHSYGQFLDKTPEQVAKDGPRNGNRALSIFKARFGPGTDYNDYISVQLDGAISTVKEIGLSSKLVQTSTTFTQTDSDDNS